MDHSDDHFFTLALNFIEIIESRQSYCKGHAATVSSLATALGRELSLSESALRIVRLGAILHDIGKFHVSPAILNKSGRLTYEEYSQIKEHCSEGREMVCSLKPFQFVSDAVSQHHEHYDGTGYPYGLKQEEIAIEARIISLADSFDAMTSSTTYKRAISVDAAVEEIKAHAGRQFDPQLVDVFLKIPKPAGCSKFIRSAP